MKFTVLGRCGPYPRANEACSGYLVQAGTTRLLVDCGAGVLPRLRSVTDIQALDAIALSHLHYDHCADMAVLRYMLEQFPRAPLPVYCPGEPSEALAIFNYPVFDIRPLHDGMQAAIGALSLRFHAAEHPVPTFGIDIESADGARLFYTGDTGWFDGLIALCQGAHALLADCCFCGEDETRTNIHLSARQAASLAQKAGVKALYCTHLWGGRDNDDAVLSELDFTPATVVQEGHSYEVFACTHCDGDRT